LTILLLHTGMKHFKNVKYRYLANGVTLREHKNCRCLPYNTLHYECKVYVVTFLQNYADENAILLPGRIPRYKRDNIQLLPLNNQGGLYISQNLLCSVIYHSNPQGVWMQYKISGEVALVVLIVSELALASQKVNGTTKV